MIDRLPEILVARSTVSSWPIRDRRDTDSSGR
jgi:hypothetical protein